MTFALVRAGLPNSIAMLALALTPFVAIVVAAAPQTHPGPPQQIEMAVTDGTIAMAGEQANAD